MRKIKFFLIGLIPGLLLVMFILNKKGASCSGYLPNSRVIAETLSKDFAFSEEVKETMAQQNIDEKYLRDSILTNGYVDFARSQAQQQPCPAYTLVYPKKNPRYEVYFEKCEEQTLFKSLKKLP